MNPLRAARLPEQLGAPLTLSLSRFARSLAGFRISQPTDRPAAWLL